MFLARSKPVAPLPTLSVIVPAYNEKATLSVLMDRLLAKSIDGVDIEIVLVESNSSDGTREDAIRYGQHPRVRLILQDRPRGKGHAVRDGPRRHAPATSCCFRTPTSSTTSTTTTI